MEYLKKGERVILSEMIAKGMAEEERDRDIVTRINGVVGL